jgi:hypothetical protein
MRWKGLKGCPVMGLMFAVCDLVQSQNQAADPVHKKLRLALLHGAYNTVERPFAPELEAAMSTFAAGILLVVFLVFVVVPLIVIASVRLFLSILDYSHKVPPHTLRQVH